MSTSIWLKNFRRTLALVSVLATLATGLKASPGWDSFMNYQGQLTDSGGNAVADGAYSIQFTVYDAASGGSVVWTETQPSVQVSKGLFNVVLGSVVTIDFGSNYDNLLWLAVKVGADAEMTPRQQLLPAVYAYNARRLNGSTVGNGAFNIPQLDASGKLPASMIAAGAVSVPLDMVGAGGAYNLRLRNDTTGGIGVSVSTAALDNASAIGLYASAKNGTPISASASSTINPAIYGDGAKFGAMFRTEDAGAGIGAIGYGGYMGVSGSGASYGVYGSGGTYGVYGNGGLYGLYGNSNNYGVYGSGGTYGIFGASSNYGVYGQGGTFGFYGTGVYGGYFQGGTYGVYGYSSGSIGVRADSSSGTGLYATSAGGAGKAVYAQHTGSGAGFGVDGETAGTAAGAKGVYGLASVAATSGATYGVYGQSSSTFAGSTGVYGIAFGSSGATYGVYGQTNSPAGYAVYGVYSGGAAGTAKGVVGSSNSTTGVGVEGSGYVGVRGTSTYLNGFGVSGSSSDNNGAGVYSENTSAGSNATALAARSLTSTTGVGILVMASGVGVTATAATYGVYALGTGTGGIGGYFGSPSNIGAVADGYIVGLSATAENGYAVNGSGYGGGQFYGASTYGLNVTSNSNWGISVNSPNSYGLVSQSNYGLESDANNGTALAGYTFASSGGTGVYGYTSSSSNGKAVSTYSSCATCYGGYFINQSSSSPAIGLYAEGYGTAISATARYTFGAAVRAVAYYPFFAQPNANGTSFYSDTSNNPYYGLYHYNSSAPNGSQGVYVVNNTTTSGGAGYFQNQLPTAGQGGYALSVQGKIRVPDCSGKVTFATAGPWTVNSATPGVGAAGANCIDSNSNIILQLATNSGYPLYITSVSNGSFTVACNQALNPVTFYYWVVGE